MERNIKCIIIGEGNMGMEAVRCMVDKGMEIIGGIDKNPALLGRDIGEIAGIAPLGVVIEQDISALLERVRPDVAFLSTETEFEKLEFFCQKCAEYHVNVVTIGEDIFYPWDYKPALSEEMDALFKKNGVTLYSTGIQEVWLAGLGLIAGGTCKKVNSVTVSSLLPLNDMGLVVADEYHVGQTPEEFSSITATVDANVLNLQATCKAWGLHITDTKFEYLPVLAEKDEYFPQWDKHVPAGNLIGYTLYIRVQTEEGIEWIRETTYKTTDPEKEMPATHWYIKGEPNLHITVDDICGEITTSATTVNRIPDVLAAAPGLCTFVDLNNYPSYLAKTPKIRES